VKKIQAWHFVGKTLRDGSPIPRNGKVLKFPGPLEMCATGLHASREPFDALQYAPGETLCLVECGGQIIEGGDKLVCSERTIIARIDATEMLRYFARMQALSVIHLYPNGTDDVVFDYLMTGDESLRAAAWTAAWTAARAAARDAAWAAAWDAARAAARAATSAAAWAAAWTAARAAAWAAASAAARDAARRDFNELTRDCFWKYL
jgi:hypothetical protein